MKYFPVIAFAFIFCVNAAAQEETEKPKAGSFRKPLEAAQKSKETSTSQIDKGFDDGCGNALTDSQVYTYRNGRAIIITDDNKIIVKVLPGIDAADKEYTKAGKETKKSKPAQLFTISLVGIDETVNQSEVKRFLLDNVLDREVTVIGNARKDDDKKVDALVRITSGEETGEVSRLLLEKGIAKFKEFQLTNLVPMRTACELKRAEEKAKTENLGLWAK